MQFVDTLRNPTDKGLEQREAGNFPLQDDFKWPLVCGLEEFCIIQIYFAQKNYLKSVAIASCVKEERWKKNKERKGGQNPVQYRLGQNLSYAKRNAVENKNQHEVEKGSNGKQKFTSSLKQIGKNSLNIYFSKEFLIVGQRHLSSQKRFRSVVLKMCS